MNKALKIGLSALSGLGVGTFFALKLKGEKEKDCGCHAEKSKEVVKKIIGNTSSDDFNSYTLSSYKAVPIAQKEHYKKDLKKWGTKQGVIEVANNELEQKKKKNATQSLSNKRFDDRYQKDLKKWGTKQGVIDVSNDEQEKKQKEKEYNQMVKMGDALVKKHLPKTLHVKTRPIKKLTPFQDWYTWLKKEFDVAQVAITNTSSEEKTIRLWGANQGIAVSEPSAGDVEDQEVVATLDIPSDLGVGIHPQGLAFNPANGFTYVANQLSNNVTVIAPDGKAEAIIQLQPSNFPGYNSPVAIAVNTNSSSSNFGKVYVIGSVSNTVSVINLSHQVTTTIDVGNRPLAVKFNPVNDNLYVANLVGDDLTVIDTTTETVSTTLPVGTDPLGIGIRNSNGEIYVANSGDNSVSVFDSNNTPITTILGVGNKPVSITHNPVNDEMYVVATDSNNVFPIDTVSYTAFPPIPVGNSPYNIEFNSNNDFLYVGNSDDETYTIIAPDKSIRATISSGNVNVGFAFNQTENLLFASDTENNTVSITGYPDQSSSVIVDGDLLERIENFKYNPGIVKHVKFVLSGEERFKVLTLREERSTGAINEVPLSFRTHDSPQNFLNVSEVFSLEGSIIDGQNSWIFKLAGLQSVTILIYYRQFKMYRLIPQETSKSKAIREKNTKQILTIN